MKIKALLLLAAAASILTNTSFISADIIDRVSISAAGVSGDGTSDAVAINRDGSIIAFRSDSTNLGPTDGNGLSDVYVKNMATGKVELLSQSAAGVAGDQFSGGSQSDERPIRISSDGRFVVFASTATTLAGPGVDSNVVGDIFLRDRTLNTITIASLNGVSTQGDQQADSPAISDDGQSITFDSFSGLFSPVDTNGFNDTFLRTLGNSTTVRTSNNITQTPANGNARLASISGDGMKIVYQSSASDHVPVDTNFSTDIFLYDTATQTISRLSTSSGGNDADGGSQNADISNDGLFVVFESDAANLVADGSDGNGETDIYIKDVVNGGTELISSSLTGVAGNGGSYSPAVSADGRFVAFKSDASDLVESDLNATTDVFVRDRMNKSTKRISLRSNGAESNGIIGYLAISGNGQYVVYSSSDDLLVPGDSNQVADLYRVQINDTLTSDTTIASPPAVTVKKKAVKLQLQLFAGIEAPTVSALPKRRNIVEYTVTVREMGKGGDRRKIVTSRNQITVKNLRPGNYTASYRATAKQQIITKKDGEKTVKEVTLFKTNISPRATFTIP